MRQVNYKTENGFTTKLNEVNGRAQVFLTEVDLESEKYKERMRARAHKMTDSFKKKK